MRVLVLVAAVAFAAGCTSVRMVQRDGCWIKQTEKRPFKRVREEIGPCAQAQPKWVDDRLTRLVQECVAQADRRWQARALEAWSRSRPYPAQPAQEETLRACMQEARVGLVSENEDLKRRLSETAADRDQARTLADAERARSDQERARFQETFERNVSRVHDTQDKLAGFLGEAANKPAPPAVATATATSNSEGSATTDTGTTLASETSAGSGASGAPSTATVAAPGAPAVVPASPQDGGAPTPPRPAKAVRARPPIAHARQVACDPPAAKTAPCEVPTNAPKAER